MDNQTQIEALQAELETLRKEHAEMLYTLTLLKQSAWNNLNNRGIHSSDFMMVMLVQKDVIEMCLRKLGKQTA